MSDRFEVVYPFAWEEASVPDVVDGGREKIMSWRPGVRIEIEMIAPDDAIEHALADGLGKQLLEVIGTYKPGRYPERTFYVRQWQDPDGKVFGKRKLRFMTTVAFRNLVKGYRHEYEVV